MWIIYMIHKKCQNLFSLLIFFFFYYAVIFTLAETDDCPSWISRRERMTIENIKFHISKKKMLPTQQGLNQQPQMCIQLSHRGQPKKKL